MAEETHYTANTGLVTISTANSNLDGTGTLGTIFTGAANGTLIKRIFIKAQGNTTQGMVRIFITGGGATELIAEVEIPAITRSTIDPSFEITVPINYALKNGYVLKASTENAETFDVVAEGLDWSYYTTSVREECTKYTAITGMVAASTANSNMDGSGTVYTVIQAGTSGGGWLGCKIKSIIIKNIVNTTDGMIRIFIQNSAGSATKLIHEVPVPAVTKSATAVSFSHTISFDDGLCIQAGYKLIASTQNAQTSNIFAEGADWKYPA